MKHRTQLCPAGKPADANVSSEGTNLFLEEGPGQKGCQLSKHCITMGHGLRLLLMGSVFGFFPWYTVVYGSPSLFSSLLVGESKHSESLSSQNMSLIQNSRGRKNGVLHVSSYCLRRYAFRSRTKTAAVHNPQPDSSVSPLSSTNQPISASSPLEVPSSHRLVAGSPRRPR